MKMGSAAYRLTEAARRRVLEHLGEHGPSFVAEIPRRWPVTRPLIHWAVQDLVDDGEVRWVGAGNPRRVTLTELGLRARCR